MNTTERGTLLEYSKLAEKLPKYHPRRISEDGRDMGGGVFLVTPPIGSATDDIVHADRKILVLLRC